MKSSAHHLKFLILSDSGLRHEQTHLVVLSCAVMSVQADVDKRFYKKRTMGLDLQVRDGFGPKPVNCFDPLR